jgi:hypothetical protein
MTSKHGTPAQGKSNSERRVGSPTHGQKFPSFNWMRGVSDDTRISIVHRLILLRICLHRRNDSGLCEPGYDEVKNELGVGRVTVFRAVDAGIRCGWLAPFASHGGRVKRNFVFTFPITQQSPNGDTVEQSPSGETVGRATVSKRRSNSIKNGPQQYQGTLQPVESASQSPTLREKNGRKKEREKKVCAAHTHSPAPECAALEAEAEALAADAFSDFWKVYPNKAAEDAARRAFIAAVVAGAAPAALVAGAKLYAVSEQARTAREGKPWFTAYAANWIKAGRWKDPPPEGTVIDEHGTVVAIEQPTTQQPEDYYARDLADEAAAAGLGQWKH